MAISVQRMRCLKTGALVVGALVLVFATGFVVAGMVGDAEHGPEQVGRQAESSSAPTTEDVVVTLEELRPPYDVLYASTGGTSCTTVNVTDQIFEGFSQPVELTLFDAGGDIIGVQELARLGGDWSAAGCEWSVTFPRVAASDYYEVRATTRNGEYSARGSASDLEIQF